MYCHLKINYPRIMKAQNNNSIFMRGRWENLIIRTYKCGQTALQKYLPKDVELDLWQGEALVSMVAFNFSKVNFFGIKVPFHQDFAQINFRTYVKSKKDGTKGVLFLRELAPKPIIALMANLVYNEPFYFLNVKNKYSSNPKGQQMMYHFKRGQKTGKVVIQAAKKALDLTTGTLAKFTVDRYVSFVKSTFSTLANRYDIGHRPWKRYAVEQIDFDDNILDLLPKDITQSLHKTALSTYFVDGSAVEVSTRTREQKGEPLRACIKINDSTEDGFLILDKPLKLDVHRGK